jgi:hypothetical protein
VAVVLTNRSAKPVRVYWEDSNSVVFEAVTDRSLRVVYHGCACMMNRDAGGKAFHATIAPGGNKALRFDDWGCSGTWPPPPPGAYDVTFRAFLEEPRPGVAKGERLTPASCQSLIQSAAFWKGAVSSPPLRAEVKRGKPVRPAKPRPGGAKKHKGKSSAVGHP